jgi:hypothetical protein
VYPGRVACQQVHREQRIREKYYQRSFHGFVAVHNIFVIAVRRAKAPECGSRYWEIIADNLSKAGWSWGCVSAIDSQGRTIWITDAHRDGKRFIVRADELLTAFLELQRAVCIHVLTEEV